MREIKGILFDFDDTLQDREKAFYDYSVWFMEKYFKNLSADEKAKRIRFMDVNMDGGYKKRPLYFSQLKQAWGWDDSPELQALEDEYNDRLPVHTVLFPDTVSTLDELAARGYRLGVLTNGFSPLQHKKLDISGIRSRFHTIVVSGDNPFAKPDARLFLLAAEKMELEPNELAMIGDHPINDVKGALGAGIYPVWMNYGYFSNQPPQGVRSVKTMSGLLDIFPGAGLELLPESAQK